MDAEQVITLAENLTVKVMPDIVCKDMKRKTYKHLLQIVETKGYSKDKAIEIARLWRKRHLLDKTIGDALFTETEQISDLVFRFYVYDFYVIEELGLFQLLRHYVRKGLAAALLYVGVDTPVVVIVNEARLPLMDGACEGTDKRFDLVHSTT